MILNTTTKKIQLLLGATVASTQCAVTVDYVDYSATATTPGLVVTQSNNVSAVDIVPAPAANAQRKVNYMSICNRDTDFISVTVRLNDNGTLYNYLSNFLLAPNTTLQFTDMKGWTVIDAAGNLIVAQSAISDIQVFTSNGLWVKPTGATYAMVDMCGGGGSGGGAGSAVTTAASGGGGGGAKRVQMQFLTKDLENYVKVTVGSGGSSVAAVTDGNAGSSSYFGSYLIAWGGGGGSYQSAAAGGSGGGGGGGNAVGGTSGTNAGATGGTAFATTLATAAYPDDRGGSAGNSPSIGYGSYLGGAAGGGGGTTTPGAGASSVFSAGGGGGGGGLSSNNTFAGANGGSAGYFATSLSVGGLGGAGGTTTGNPGSAGANGDFSIFGIGTRMGQGGGGGGSGTTTGGRGGDGGYPGGGGGGGGGGQTGGASGKGGDGRVIVYSW